MFNSLVVNEQGTVKMMNDLACEIIGTGKVNVTFRDGMMCALEEVRYAIEARYNLISIGVLDEK